MFCLPLKINSMKIKLQFEFFFLPKTETKKYICRIMTIKRRKGNKGNSNMNGFNLPASTNCITKDNNNGKRARITSTHTQIYERARVIKAAVESDNHQFGTKFRRVRLVVR